MAWTHYPLKFRLKSPMHIGYRKVGNLMQTRRYVPGKNLWAALTARLTRDFPEKNWNRGYKEVGKRVAEQFRFGYLWPSLDGNNPCCFWDREDFDYLFLDSYASTALDYSACSAEEGSLHETEFIAPVARNGKPVYLLGDLWVNEGAKIDDESWQGSMENLQLGGERTYGWGRLALCLNEWNGNINGSGETVVGHSWRVEGEEVVVTLSKNEMITAHALAAIKIAPQSGTSATTTDVAGAVEPMVGREWSAFAGQKVSYSGVYFSPGGKVVKKEARFVIDPFGRWASYVNKVSHEIQS
ncbi:MAG: hypothetical protein QUS07_08970 [Methanothrix sp.]|nr:hypothetical protein [Methanothrix sp.]